MTCVNWIEELKNAQAIEEHIQDQGYMRENEQRTIALKMRDLQNLIYAYEEDHIANWG